MMAYVSARWCIIYVNKHKELIVGAIDSWLKNYYILTPVSLARDLKLSTQAPYLYMCVHCNFAMHRKSPGVLYRGISIVCYNVCLDADCYIVVHM